MLIFEAAEEQQGPHDLWWTHFDWQASAVLILSQALQDCLQQHVDPCYVDCSEWPDGLGAPVMRYVFVEGCYIGSGGGGIGT